jgi:hypothetical protein
MARKDRVNKKVTRVEEERNITTGRLTSIRFTQREDDLFDTLISLVQEKLPNKKISKSRVIRSISYIEDESFIDSIVQSIKNNC